MRLIAIAAVGFLLAAACGGGSSEEVAAPTSTPSGPTATPVPTLGPPQFGNIEATWDGSPMPTYAEEVLEAAEQFRRVKISSESMEIILEACRGGWDFECIECPVEGDISSVLPDIIEACGTLPCCEKPTPVRTVPTPVPIQEAWKGYCQGELSRAEFEEAVWPWGPPVRPPAPNPATCQLFGQLECLGPMDPWVVEMCGLTQPCCSEP